MPIVGGTSVPEAESTEAADEINGIVLASSDVVVGASDDGTT